MVERKVSNGYSILIISFFKWGNWGVMERQNNLIWTMQLVGSRTGTKVQVSDPPVSYSFHRTPIFPFGISGARWVSYDMPEESWSSGWAAALCERPVQSKRPSKYNILWHDVLLAEPLSYDLGGESTALKDMSREVKNRLGRRWGTGMGWGTRRPFRPLGRVVVFGKFLARHF